MGRKISKTFNAVAFAAMLMMLSAVIVVPVKAYMKAYDATTLSFGCELVTIIRDNYGVPHVFAKTREGLAFGCGYAMAQDRLWQADVFRRSAFGNLAELGLATIEQDYEIRKWGYSREELREIYEKWVPKKPHLKDMMKAYVDGINLYITQAQIKALLYGDYSMLPLEYLPGVITSDGLLPIEPFTIEDCVAITVMMAWRFGGCGGSELQYAAALQALIKKHGSETGWLIFNDLFPQNDPGAEVTIPSDDCDGQACTAIVNLQFDLPSSIGQVCERFVEAKGMISQLFDSLGIPTKFGSNAWMVSPSKSKSGNALQVGGPQMGHSIPQIVLEVGLHGAGIDAVGMMMPQGPFVLIGVSEYGAWTSTTGVSDVMDTYIEVLNPLNHTQYLYNNQWVPMEVRTERIYGYKKTTWVDKPVYRTLHGPVFMWDEANHLAFSMKTPYYKNELAAEEGWMLFQEARNIEEFQEAVKLIQPSHNFYWIDRAGNIGYWHAGTFPIKPATGRGGRIIDDRLPLYGTGEEEWVGLTGFDEMPKCINPPQGWLANWNNKPIANWPYAESDAQWGQGHRVKRLMDLLASKDKFSFEDMNLINMDAGYNHIPGMNFLHYLIESAEEAAPSDPDVAAALPYLKAWNHHYNDVLNPKWPDSAATYDDPGLTIFEEWYKRILIAVFADDIPDSIMKVREWQSSTLIHVFDGPYSKLPLQYDYLNGANRNTVIVGALKDALAYLNATKGPNISNWLTPVIKVKFSQLGALPAPTMHYMNRGTYNHIAEMPRRSWLKPNAVNVIPPGQSGFIHLVNGEIVVSSHAYDQLPLYETWTYKPVLLRFLDIWKVRESITFLLYVKK
ncbi:MAG: penicillin acylase family protein [Candidatus Bathyarchaeia archaeon]